MSVQSRPRTPKVLSTRAVQDNSKANRIARCRSANPKNNRYDQNSQYSFKDTGSKLSKQIYKRQIIVFYLNYVFFKDEIIHVSNLPVTGSYLILKPQIEPKHNQQSKNHKIDSHLSYLTPTVKVDNGSVSIRNLESMLQNARK